MIQKYEILSMSVSLWELEPKRIQTSLICSLNENQTQEITAKPKNMLYLMLSVSVSNALK